MKYRKKARKAISSQVITKATISIVALVGGTAHLLWPELKIDSVTLGFLLLALLPWAGSIIKSLEVPGLGKVELHQPPGPEAVRPGGHAEQQILATDASGFYTAEGLVRIIGDSDLVSRGENVVRNLLLFRTRTQRTWLLATPKHMFCILDDRRTRSSGRLIQWRADFADLAPIRARTSSDGTTIVTLGSKGSWLYSSDLYPDGSDLETAITDMIEEARKSST
jgi:hypothetical protein